MRILIIIALVTCSCTNSIKEREMKKCPYPAEEMRAAELRLERMLLERHNIDVTGWTRKIVIECVDRPVPYGDVLLDGKAEGPRYAWFATQHPDGRHRELCSTAHLHELTHCLLEGKRFLYGDYEHTHPVWADLTPAKICGGSW